MAAGVLAVAAVVVAVVMGLGFSDMFETVVLENFNYFYQSGLKLLDI